MSDDTAASTATIEVNDALFCSTHQKEVCTQCDFDGREENDGFFGFTPWDREPLELPTASPNKDGAWQCKKHGSAECSQCFGWKKQITKLQVKAKKAGKKAL
ncbi:hypothetical protein M422DRAFT_39876 [Sphaerobolus stellatus SS14]|uniref:Uncharacterized protein n=1 Tax=Sphaerobolus stellatus (strain SS14) TaxID=990650 RepID=A0A0C9T2D7_SPHS4|nr:hypothetical protein M422DRAFT_39876 [Sphaerobolus stellatus SS14]